MLSNLAKSLNNNISSAEESLANGKSLKDVVTYIHKKTASLALIVTMHVSMAETSRHLQ